MSWFGAEVDGSMIVTRTVHFVASATLAGALMFRGFVVEPVSRAAPLANVLVRKQVRGVAWIGLAVAVVSGLILVLLLTMSLSGESGEAVISGALRDVLNLTQFGLVSQVRLALAIVLAICLAFERSALWRWLGLAAAVSLAASIAWTGHAASTPFTLGYLHLAGMRYILLQPRPGSAAWRRSCSCSVQSGAIGAGLRWNLTSSGDFQRSELAELINGGRQLI